MNQKKVKALRRLARAATVGMPAVKYHTIGKGTIATHRRQSTKGVLINLKKAYLDGHAGTIKAALAWSPGGKEY